MLVDELGIPALFAEISAQHAESVRPLDPAEAREVRETCSLPQFYERCMSGHRERQLAERRVKPGTLSKERQALGRFEQWEQREQPDAWPAGITWHGLPIGYITGPYLQRFFDQFGLSAGTAHSTWSHLRTVLNHAVKLRVLDRAPSAPKLPERGGEDDEDLCKTTFSLAELGRLYRQLADQPALQSALVVGANCGPRTVDLFGLRWGKNVKLDRDPPEIWYRARKTGKRHWCPLAPVTAAHIARLRPAELFEAHALVFPSLTSGRSKDPERSRAARQRTAAFKAAMQAVGLPTEGDYAKPFQVLRATCNTRLNAHAPGIGRFLLHGASHDVNEQSYFNFVGPARDAVLSLPQPPEFLES